MAATMTEQLADAIRTAATGYGYGWDITTSRSGPRQLARPCVMIRQNTVTKPSGQPPSVRVHHFDVLLLVPNKDPDKADQQLEPRLDNLLDLLDGLPAPWRTALLWQEAERLIFSVADGIDFHGYRLPLDVGTAKER